MIKSCSLADNSSISSGGSGGGSTIATNIPEHIYVDNSFDPDFLAVGNLPIMQLFEGSAYNGAANVPVTIEDSAAPTTSADLTTPSAHPTNGTYLGKIMVIPAGTLIIDWNRCVLFGSAQIVNATGGTIAGYLANTQVFNEGLPNLGTGSVSTYSPSIPYKIDQLRFTITNPIGIALLDWQEPEAQVDSEQFDSYILGETTFFAERWESSANVAMIIDSDSPPIAALGTPNASVGGPGVGVGTGNIHNRGNLIAITNGNTTAQTVFAGTLTWYPFAPVSLCSAGLVNATGGTINLYRAGSIVHTRTIPDGGTNGYQLVKIDYGGTTDQVEFILTNTAAIAGINYYGRAVPDYGFVQTEMFNSFREAEPTAENNQWLTEDSAIVDTEGTIVPTQFRTPHTDFAGTGVGAAGQAGPTQNDTARGKGIINTASHETLIPAADPYTFTFRGNTIITKLIFVGGNPGTVTIGGVVYNLAQYGANAVKVLNIYARGTTMVIASANVLVEFQYVIFGSTGISTGIHSISDISGLQTQIDNLQIQVNAKPDDLPDLGDVTIAAPAAGQVLTYQGPNWVNAAAANIYTTDDSITGARAVGLGANSLTFTGTGAMNFSSTGNHTFAGSILLNAVAEFVQTGNNYRLSNVNATVGATTTLHQGGTAAGDEAIVLTNDASGFPSITLPNIDQFVEAAPSFYITATGAGLLQRSPVTNLYVADGTLGGNRAVTMNANSLTFIGTGQTNFNSTGATNFNNTLTFNAIGSVRQETTNLTINQETAAVGSTFTLRVGGLLAANEAVELENHASGFAQVRLPNIDQFAELAPTHYVTVDGSGNLERTPVANLANIYTTDGTLGGNRAVTMGANSLSFTGTGQTNFNSTGATNFNNTMTFNSNAELLETGNDFNIRHLDSTVAAGMSLYAGGTAADKHGLRLEVGSNDEGNVVKAILPNIDGFEESDPSYYVTVDGSGVLYRTDASAVGTLYNKNGTLSSARTVTMGANALNFAGTADFNIATTGTVNVAGNMLFGATGSLQRENTDQDFAISGIDATVGSALVLRGGGLATADEGIRIINNVSGFAEVQLPNISNYTDASPAYFISASAGGNLTRTATANVPNLYSTDGTLAGNRAVNQANNTLTFTNAHIGIELVDTDTSLTISNSSGATTNLMLTGGNSDPTFPAYPADNQLITFGFGSTNTYRHRLQSVHNAGVGFMGNRLIFSLWDPEDNTLLNELGAKRAFTIGDDFIMFDDYTPGKSHEATGNTGATWKNLQITQTGFVITSDVPVIAANLDMGTNRATNAADPVALQDLITLNYFNNNPINLYTTNGTLGAARTVTMGANSISFNGTGAINFNTTGTVLVAGSIDANATLNTIKSSAVTNTNLSIGDATVGEIPLNLNRGASNVTAYDVDVVETQLSFGFNGTGQYRHAIKSKHDAAGTHMGNTIEMYLWDTSLAATDVPDTPVMTISDFIGFNLYKTAAKLENTGGASAATQLLGTDSVGKVVQYELPIWAQLEFTGVSISYSPLGAVPVAIGDASESFISSGNFTRSANGVVRYDGALTRNFEIIAIITINNDDASLSRSYQLRINKNGAAAYDPLGHNVRAGVRAKLTTHYIVSLAQNDTISCSIYISGIGVNSRVIDYNYTIKSVD